MACVPLAMWMHLCGGKLGLWQFSDLESDDFKALRRAWPWGRTVELEPVRRQRLGDPAEPPSPHVQDAGAPPSHVWACSYPEDSWPLLLECPLQCAVMAREHRSRGAG